MTPEPAAVQEARHLANGWRIEQLRAFKAQAVSDADILNLAERIATYAAAQLKDHHCWCCKWRD